MGLTGDMDVRIDFTNPANQVKGLDLNGDGVIANDGIENNITGRASNFKIVDAYARVPLNESNVQNNFLGDIAFDGTGFGGDGVTTDGNIVLGGLGVDTVYGGIGNDFLTGGGIAAERVATARAAWIASGGTAANFVAPSDTLSGGRNADFFFVELSALDATDGNRVNIDGGTTADDSAAGTVQTAQDADWLLFEGSDDDEPVTINLRDESANEGAGSIVNRSGQTNGTLRDIENFDASGNLYGFLDTINVELGGRRTDDREVQNGTLNNGIGSSAQLVVSGSAVANIIVGGYDNDAITGNAGDDLLMGGNLRVLINPNLTGLIVNDGTDNLYGNAGNDNIVFEADGGIVQGGTTDTTIETAVDANGVITDNDTLWLTDLALGTQTAEALTSDSTHMLRFDLDSQNIDTANGYGGANIGTKDGVANDNQDQSWYNTGVARTTVRDMDNVIATGMGAIDYDTDGSNAGDIAHLSQVNIAGYAGNLDLRGTAFANTLFASSGNDNIEGRAGDDSLSGGGGSDDFIFFSNVGDGVDVIHRQNETVAGSNLWNGTYGRDFGLGGTAEGLPSTLNIDIGNTAASLDVRIVSFYINGTQMNVNNPAATLGADMASLAAAIQTSLAAQAPAGVTFTVTATNGAGLNGTLSIVATPVEYTDAGGTVHVKVTPQFVQTLDTAFVDTSVSVFAGSNASAFSSDSTEVRGGQAVTEDRLIFASYEDRADGELVDDNGMVNHTGDAVTLGNDGYAEDLVVRFNNTGVNSQGSTTVGDTIVAEDQVWTLTFNNLADEDTVTLSVNGTAFSLQMGVAADGTAIIETQEQFIERLEQFINSVADNDTLAGTLVATHNADVVLGTSVLTLTQGNYNGGQDVFMDRPEVTLGNASGGESASVTVTKTGTNTEITIADYDATNGGFTAANVLFLGGSGMNDGEVTDALNSRSVLATALSTGSTLTGKDALVVDTMTDANTVATDFSLHGDDYLIGGIGVDTLIGGTGDDRFQGSAGNDTINGGKDLYVVQTNVAGATVETVEQLNAYEAGLRRTITIPANSNVTSVAFLEEDSATGVANGFADTAVFAQNTFDAGTDFYVTVGLSTDTNRLQQRAGGQGTVQVGDFNSATSVFTQNQGTTTFSEMEAIRTLSGDGTLAGQGRDTLDFSLISNDVAATFATTAAATYVGAGVTYNLTSDLGQIRVVADFNSIDTDSLASETIANFLAVDGVENVIGGNADDTVNIDESEVRKDNTFTGGNQTAATSLTAAGLVGDTIVYNHSDMNNDGSLDGRTYTIEITSGLNSGAANAVFNINANATAYLTEAAVPVGINQVAKGASIDVLGAALAAAMNANLAQVTADYLTEAGARGTVDSVTYDAATNQLAFHVTGASSTPVAVVLTESGFDASFVQAAPVTVPDAALAMRPSVTLKVGATTDLVTMSGGTLLSSPTVDTLNGVEGIDLNDAARSLTLRDTLDVTSVAGSIVDYQLGKVLLKGTPNTLLVDIGDMTELENVQASVTGADTVMFANNMVNINAAAWTTNTVAAGNPDFNNAFAFYRGAVNTVAVANQGLYDIDFGTGTTASAADTVDYAYELNQDIMVVLDLTGSGVDRVVVSDAAGIDGVLSTVNARVDVLKGADVYYAGGADAMDSGIDLSQHTGNLLTVQFSSNATALNTAGGTAEDVRQIQIVDGTTSIVKQFVDNGLTTADRASIAGQAAAIVAANAAVAAANVAVAAAALTADGNVDNFAAATQLAAANAQLVAANNQNADYLGNYWNRIEGNNLNETINLTDRESGHAMELNLKGGANTISYNDDSIGNTLRFDDVLADAVTAVAQQQVLTVDLTTNNVLDLTHTHTITGTVGSQRVDGSKTGNDVINMVAVATSYSIKLNVVEGSGWKGNVVLNALDANSDADYADAGDTVGVSTTVSGYENIVGNNANNSYEANTFVNAITAGMGNDAFTISSFMDINGDTWLAGTGVDTLIIGSGVSVNGAGVNTITLGNGAVGTDQFIGTTNALAYNANLAQFENVDASGVAATTTTFALTGRTDVASVLRAGAGNDSLTAAFTGTVLDGGAGADTVDFGGTAARAAYEFGDSDQASKDVVSNFTSGPDTISVRVDMAARGLTNVVSGYGEGATPTASSGMVKAFYDSTTSNLVVDMDANGSYGVTGDLTIGGIANAGAIAAGDVRFEILGSSGNNTITGSGLVDVIRGGAGLDTITGGDVAAVGEVHSFVLGGGGLAAGQTLIIDGVTVTQGATIGGVVVALTDADAVGDAFVRIWAATPAAFANVANLQSVTYNALTNSLYFNFKSTVAAVPPAAIGAAAGTGLATIGSPAEVVSTGYSAAAGTNDMFVVVGAVDATQAEVYKAKYSSQEALNADLGGINLVDLVTELQTVHTTTDVTAGDAINGQLGNDTLHVYGDADLSTTTLTSIEAIAVHSTVRLSVAQVNALSAAGSTINFDAQGIGKLIITGMTSTSNVDLSGLGLVNTDRVVFDGLTIYTGQLTYSAAGGFNPATELYLGTSATAFAIPASQMLQEVTYAGVGALIAGTYSLEDLPANLVPGATLNGAVDIKTITTGATAAQTTVLLAATNLGSTTIHAATATGAEADAFTYNATGNDTVTALSVTGAVTAANAAAIQADITAADVGSVVFTTTGAAAIDLTGLTAATVISAAADNGANAINLGAGAATYKFAATFATNGSDIITGFNSGVDKLNLDNFGAAISAKPTGAAVAYTAAADTVLYFSGLAAGTADTGLVGTIAALNGALVKTAGVLGTTFFAVLVDNNSSAVVQIVDDGVADEFTGDTITILGTVDALVSTTDLLFA